MDDLQKRSWAEIFTDSIRHNYRAIRAGLPEGCRFLGVVKADAYGHGALRVSQILEEEGADYLAVSCLDEALELRRGGIRMPILILGHTPKEYVRVLIEYDITQTVTCLAKALEFSEEASRLGKTSCQTNVYGRSRLSVFTSTNVPSLRTMTPSPISCTR